MHEFGLLKAVDFPVGFPGTAVRALSGEPPQPFQRGVSHERAVMGFLLILFASFFYKTVSGVRSLSLRDPRRYVGMGGLVGILALMFHSLVEKNIQIPSNAFLFTFIFALALHVGKDPDKLNELNKPDKLDKLNEPAL